MSVRCPFCGEVFDNPDAWCPHYVGTHAELTLDDHKDILSGEFPAEVVEDDEGVAYHFILRTGDDDDE